SRRVAPTDEFLRSGRQEFEIGEVAVENRQVFDVLLVERDGYVGAVGLELLDFAADFDGLSGVAHGERRVRARRGVCGNLNVLYFKYLEACGLDSDVVEVRNQVRDGKVAAVVGGRFFDRTLCDAGHGDLRAHDTGSLRISDRTEDAAENRL